jgi:hypothetical protein
MQLDMCIMAPEPISTAYFINMSVCLYVYPPIVARQRLGKMLPLHEYTRNKRIIVGGVIFYAVRVLSKESRRLVLRNYWNSFTPLQVNS